MTHETNRVVTHYSQGDLMDRIRNALAGAGYNPDKPTLVALSELDHLHGGGFATTEVQAHLAGITKGSYVLDAGCGIGGPSRYLAAEFGCTVEGIDLTPEYVETAQALNVLVGTDDKIRVSVGSVTELPFEDRSFDVVWSQNVLMNVADKQAMFAESFRVLKPGGVFTFSHLAEGPNGNPIYPLPWAMTPEVSFLGTPEELMSTLTEVGFVDAQDRVGEASSKPGGAPPPGTIGGAPAMGDDMPQRIANSMQSAKEGRLHSMMVVAYRPF